MGPAVPSSSCAAEATGLRCAMASGGSGDSSDNQNGAGMRTAYSKRKRRVGDPAGVTDSGKGINIYSRCEGGVWRVAR